MAKVDILITGLEKQDEQGNFILKFFYAGDPNDLQLNENEETSIEVPSHAPPPEAKK